MEDKQKVYIKGNFQRGDEVIKFLEDLGGRNIHSLDGQNSDNYYFITPEGVINNIAPLANSIFSFVKEFYTEIKLPRWKPKFKECFYRITWTGTVIKDICYSSRDFELCYKFGNCFRTFREAEATRDKIKEILQ